MKRHELEENIVTIDELCKKIAYKLLIKLYADGNPHAYNIAKNPQNDLTLEDVSQDLILFICENYKKINIESNILKWNSEKNDFDRNYSLLFVDDETKHNFFKTVGQTLYKEKTRHERKKLYVELDGELVRIDDIPTLASHSCIENIQTFSMYNSFLSYLNNRLNNSFNKYKLYTDYITLRLQGYKHKDIAKKLGKSDRNISYIAKQIRSYYKEFSKLQ